MTVNKNLKVFSRSELCSAGFGWKYHIRNGQKALCGRSSISDIGLNLIGVREDYEMMCYQCIKQYKKLSQH